MDLMWFLGLVAGILLTPGPTNTLLATAGMQLGGRRACQLVPFELLGYVIAISFWGGGMAQLAQWLPHLPNVTKALGAVYLWYLAWRLWRNARLGAAAPIPAITAKSLLVATLLNPKALLLASAVFPVAAWQHGHVYIVFVAGFAAVAVLAASAWIALGVSMRQRQHPWLQPQRLQRGAACVLALFALPLLVSALP